MNENPTTRSGAEALGQSTDPGASPYESQQGGDGMQDRARQMRDQARETMSDAGQKAQDQIDKGTTQAAGGLEQAADKVRSQTSDGGGMKQQAGTKVADSMDAAAGYLREHNTDEMLADIEHYVKTHPTTALAGAVVAGFFIGRVLR